MLVRERKFQALVPIALCWRTIPAVLIVMPVLAYAQAEMSASSPAVSTTAGQNAAGMSQSPQRSAATQAKLMPTAGLRGTRNRRLSSPSTIQTGVSPGLQGALGLGGFEYYPGFNGCASVGSGTARITGGTLLSPVQRPAGPVRSGGRFVQLSVSGSEIYTDNLNHEHNGESDFITVVTPRLDVCQSTGRVRGELSYRLQGVVYANHSNKNDVYNEVRASTTINVLPSHLYLDASTRYGQTVENPRVGYSSSNAIAPGNQTTTWTFNVSPYVVQSLGPVGLAQLRYRYGQNHYEDEDLPDSHVNAVYFNLASPPSRDLLSWHVNVTSKKVTRSGGNANEFYARRGLSNPFGSTNPGDRDDTQYFDKAVAQIGVQATDTLQLIGRGGVEDRYDNDGDNHRFSSPFWSVGFNWAAGRNAISARVGHHYYGTSYFLQAEHRAANWNASLSYREKTTSQTAQALNGGNFGRYFGSVDSHFDRGVYVAKRWQAALTYRTALTRTRIRGYYRTRNYRKSGISNDREHGASISTRYQFKPRTALRSWFNWFNRDGSGNGGSYNTYEFGVSLVHAIDLDFHVGISYLHAWRDGGAAGSDYAENRVALQVFKSF